MFYPCIYDTICGNGVQEKSPNSRLKSRVCGGYSSNGAKIIKEELVEWDSEAQKEIVNILADIIESDELIGFDRNDILSLAD